MVKQTDAWTGRQTDRQTDCQNKWMNWITRQTTTSSTLFKNSEKENGQTIDEDRDRDWQNV